jgi:hypothetical protein
MSIPVVGRPRRGHRGEHLANQNIEYNPTHEGRFGSMITAKKLSGVALAAAAAAMFAGAPVAASADSEAMVHCMGVNACKGKSSCATANNACKGQNSCKGKGFVAVSKQACEQLGGKMEGK